MRAPTRVSTRLPFTLSTLTGHDTRRNMEGCNVGFQVTLVSRKYQEPQKHPNINFIGLVLWDLNLRRNPKLTEYQRKRAKLDKRNTHFVCFQLV